jgi:uncharacterized protein (UPF0332 family)
VPDPSELIDTARQLLHASSPFPITDGTLRRAVSTAYYALFHKVLRTGALHFMGGVGTHQSGGFKLLYRGFNHGQMKKVCIELDKAALSPPYQVKLGRTRISPGMRDFATAFVQLQEARHRADYDPSPTPFSISNTSDLINISVAAITKFDQTAADERADVLAMMLVNSRQ